MPSFWDFSCVQQRAVAPKWIGIPSSFLHHGHLTILLKRSMARCLLAPLIFIAFRLPAPLPFYKLSKFTCKLKPFMRKVHLRLLAVSRLRHSVGSFGCSLVSWEEALLGVAIHILYILSVHFKVSSSTARRLAGNEEDDWLPAVELISSMCVHH